MNLKYAFTTIFLILLGVNAHGIQMSLPEISADQGDNITVAINVDDATGIAGGEIALEYDPSILVAVEVRATNLAKSLTLIANTGVEGKIIAAMAGATGLKEGSGAMLEVDFEVRADAKGESPLTLSDVELFDENGDDISVETVNGKVTVVKETEKRYPAWDVNDDGLVDILDLVLVGKHFGEDYRAENPIAGKIGVDSGKEADVWIEVQNKVAIDGREHALSAFNGREHALSAFKGVGLLAVNINVEPVSDLYGCQFDLAFDPKVLQVVGIKGGDILAQDGASTYWSVSDIDNREGRIANAIYVRRA
ncbi:MAG: cohesin domain-containing protein, partial [Candidatus Poribacteria bacterium]